MKKFILATTIASLLFTLNLKADEKTGDTKTVENLKSYQDSMLSQDNLSRKVAALLVERTVEMCHKKGYAVAATVVDRSGIVLAVSRADKAGPLTPVSSERKAVTAVSMKRTTRALMESAQKYPNAANLVYIPGTLLLIGGLPIKFNNEVVGAIGVGGAPDGKFDEECANEALDLFKSFLS
jgi:uncharacterized protein GlcG (DUF336 family)